MFDDDDPMLERVRAIALGLPEAAAKISHGRPAFFTTKIFAHSSGTEKHAAGEMAQHPQALLVDSYRNTASARLIKAFDAQA